MKTVCIDLRALQIGHQNRGIGMHLISVLEHLPADSNILYVFYCFDKSNPIKTLGIKLKIEYTLVQTPTIKTALDSPTNILGILKLISHRFTALKEYKPDTFVQFDFMLGMPKWRKTKKIIIGYDLIPLIKKNEYIPSVRYAWHHSIGKKAKLKNMTRAAYYKFRYSLHYKAFSRADKILCISEATARSFRDILNIPTSKLTTIPLAPVVSSNKVDDKIAKTIKKPYLFYIGGTDSRKRIQDIVYAFNIVKGRGADIALVLAGNEFRIAKDIPSIEGRKAILSSPYLNDIHLVGFISNEEKMGLYGGAVAFVFTSAYEGFGLPVVEAMAASCPVISYDNSSIPEAAGDAGLLVHTGDYVKVAHEILRLESSPNLRAKLIKTGTKQAGKFSWHEYTSNFLEQLTS